MHKINTSVYRIFFAFVMLVVFIEPSLAASTGLPWEGPLTTILASIQGPVVQTVAILGIIGAGAILLFGDLGGGAKIAMKIVIGISIMVGAPTILSGLFSFSGGALI